MNETIILDLPLIEWVGYVASTLVLISLSLSSILRLRIFNLFGSAAFSFYGFYIGALPVGIMNFIIVLANIYYLRQLYFKKDAFQLIQADINQAYVQEFLKFYNKDIVKYFPDFKNDKNENLTVLMMMRNMNLAGLFMAENKGDELEMVLDYVTPQYRDYKNGSFFYSHFKSALEEKDVKNIITQSDIPQQVKYLRKMGFEEIQNTENKFCLQIA
jgi:N-acetylglutamate synthase-like GNAT family acetyltransferase